MNSGEIFPVLSGLIFGVIAGRFLRRPMRGYTAIPAGLLLGYCVSAATGELRISWFFGLIDAALILVSSVVGWAVCHYLRLSSRRA